MFLDWEAIHALAAAEGDSSFEVAMRCGVHLDRGWALLAAGNEAHARQDLEAAGQIFPGCEGKEKLRAGIEVHRGGNRSPLIPIPDPRRRPSAPSRIHPR